MSMSGFMQISTSVGGTLYIDGQRTTELSPFEKYTTGRIEAGPHRILIEKGGYEQVAEDTMIRPGETVTRQFTMRRKPAGSTAAGGSIASVSYERVKPSGNFTSAENDKFSLSYPDNWQLFCDASGAVTIAPPAGVVKAAVAYGVVINAANNASSLDQATRDLISGLEQSNPGLRANGGPQVVRVNRVEGRSVDLTGQSPVEQDGRPAAEHDWLVVLPRPAGGMLYTVFIAPERDFDALRPTYENMLRSLHLR